MSSLPLFFHFLFQIIFCHFPPSLFLFSVRNAGSSGDNVLWQYVLFPFWCIRPSLHGESLRSINVSTLQCTYMRTDIIGIYFYFFFVLKQDLDLLQEKIKSVLFCFLRDPKRLEDDGHWKKCRRWYSSSSTNRPLITMHLPQSNTNAKSEHHCFSDRQCCG